MNNHMVHLYVNNTLSEIIVRSLVISPPHYNYFINLIAIKNYLVFIILYIYVTIKVNGCVIVIQWPPNPGEAESVLWIRYIDPRTLCYDARALTVQ